MRALESLWRSWSCAPGVRRSNRWCTGALATLVMLTGLAASGCAPGPDSADPSPVKIALEFDPSPRVGRTTCHVRLTDEEGVPVDGATVRIEGNMNHAGMVPIFGTAQSSESGVYPVPLDFTMGGDWFVIVQVELQDGRSVEEMIPVPGVIVIEKGMGHAAHDHASRR